MSFQVSIHYTDGETGVYGLGSFPVVMQSYARTVVQNTDEAGKLLPYVESIILTDVEAQHEILTYS